jgi:hypothetical protein
MRPEGNRAPIRPPATGRPATPDDGASYDATTAWNSMPFVPHGKKAQKKRAAIEKREAHERAVSLVRFGHPLDLGPNFLDVAWRTR